MNTSFGIAAFRSRTQVLRLEDALRRAKHFVDTHELPVPLITVNSWNEWTESSYLEPDDLYGYGYLEANKRVFVEE